MTIRLITRLQAHFASRTQRIHTHTHTVAVLEQFCSLTASSCSGNPHMQATTTTHAPESVPATRLPHNVVTGHALTYKTKRSGVLLLRRVRAQSSRRDFFLTPASVQRRSDPEAYLYYFSAPHYNIKIHTSFLQRPCRVYSELCFFILS